VSSINDDQKRALLRWLGYSVVFGLLPYGFTAAFETRSNVLELFGDGSLNFVGLGLTVAAGVTTFGDASRVRSYLTWFFFIGISIAITAASYAYIRSELRSAGADPGGLPDLRSAVTSGLERSSRREGESGEARASGCEEQATGAPSDGQAPSEAEVNEELRSVLGTLGEQLQEAEEQIDPTALKIDALKLALHPIAAELDHRRENSEAALREARITAMVVGVMSLVMGVLIGGIAEYSVNGRTSRNTAPPSAGVPSGSRSAPTPPAGAPTLTASNP
jgi:hypothetical protein